MSLRDSLGTRMKGYEDVHRIFLTKRMPMIIRLDGKAFRSFTKGFEKPWDTRISDALCDASTKLLEHIQGSKFIYCQSDEISILITDYDSLEFEPWFNKNLQKMTSISASITTAEFNKSLVHLDWDTDTSAYFDARCFVLPKEEVVNYFIWRQNDAVRNSIQSLDQKHFSHKELQNKNCNEVQNMLLKTYDINWNNIETWKKRGFGLYKKTTELDNCIRTVVEIDLELPIFSHDREFLNKFFMI